jgi:ABC-type antimicrobial peptide transport system permease subunit
LLSIYESIRKKEKEIGVLLAYGLSKNYFFKFYLLEAFMLWASSSLMSFVVYFYLIDGYINSHFQDSSLVSSMTSIVSSKITSLNTDLLALPINTYIEVYALSYLFISVFFLSFIAYFIKKLPINLMRG